MWPEFEVIIEDDSEDNADMSESNALANSLVSKNKTDGTMNSLLENFQVLLL